MYTIQGLILFLAVARIQDDQTICLSQAAETFDRFIAWAIERCVRWIWVSCFLQRHLIMYTVFWSWRLLHLIASIYSLAWFWATVRKGFDSFQVLPSRCLLTLSRRELRVNSFYLINNLYIYYIWLLVLVYYGLD